MNVMNVRRESSSELVDIKSCENDEQVELRDGDVLQLDGFRHTPLFVFKVQLCAN